MTAMMVIAIAIVIAIVIVIAMVAVAIVSLTSKKGDAYERDSGLYRRYEL